VSPTVSSERINRSEPAPRPTGVSKPELRVVPRASSEDADLVTRAQRGDADALEALARQELPRVERLLGRILGPRADFEDLVQTVFLEMVRSLPRYRGDSRFSTWVGGICVRVAKRAVRPSAYERRRGEMPAALEAEGRDPEGRARGERALAHLHAALDAIAPKKRVAFTLWALAEMTPAEIAEVTEAKPNTVRARIFHARKELKALAEILGDPDG